MAELPYRNEEKTKFAPVPADVWDLRLLDITPKEGQFGTYWSWKFEITQHPHTGRWLWLSTHNNLSPTAKSKSTGPRELASTLLGRVLDDDELLTGRDYLDQLIGLPARGAVGIVPGRQDGEPRNVLNALLPARPDQIGASAVQASSSAAAVESDKESVSLDDRYLNLRDALGWDVTTALEMIEKWTEKGVKFRDLTVAEKKMVLKWMERLSSENDPPFNSTNEEDELTSAGLVSPTAPAAVAGAATKSRK